MSTLPVTAESPAELTKTDLENEKLRLEIRQLGEPWWRRPAYVGVLLPTVLAFGTLLTAYRAHYFDNQAKLLALQNESAKQERNGLNAEKEKLQENIAGLQGRKDELEQARAANELKFKNEQGQLDRDLAKLNADRVVMVTDAQAKRQELMEKRAQLEAEYKRQREVLDKQLAGMGKELEDLAKKKKQIEIEKAGLQAKFDEEVALAPIRVNLDTLLHSNENDYRPGGDAPSNLIKVLRASGPQHPEYEQELEKALPEAKTPLVRGYLLFVLFQGTGDAKWKEQLFRLTREQNSKLPNGYWRIFIAMEWDPSQTVEMWEMLSETMEAGAFKDSDETNILEAFRFFRGDTTPYAAFHNKDNYFNCVRRARDLALNRNLGYSRIDAFDALKTLAPPAYLVAMAQEITAREPDVNLISRDADMFARSFRGINGRVTKGLLDQLNVPRDMNASSWKDWVKDHRQLVDRWTEPGLGSVRQSPALLDAGSE